MMIMLMIPVHFLGVDYSRPIRSGNEAKSARTVQNNEVFIFGYESTLKVKFSNFKVLNLNRIIKFSHIIETTLKIQHMLKYF